MSFLRHREIYRPMVTGKTPERSGCDRSGLIGTMSFRLAIPGGLPSGSARFRFTSQAQNALQWSCRSRILQRTVNSVLFDCLSAGVHPRMMVALLPWRFRCSFTRDAAHSGLGQIAPAATSSSSSSHSCGMVSSPSSDESRTSAMSFCREANAAEQ